MKQLTVFAFLLLSYGAAPAQTSLTGSVQSTTDETLPRINIMVYLPDSEVLIAFAISDEHGHFVCGVKSDSDSLRIEVSSIQYRSVSRMIANVSQRVDFEMLPETHELKGVSVRARAIGQRGDTLSFLVSSFAREDDRSIEEVLRRIPGIEVESSGKILYQGMPLNKFYVEGLDLMDGRYGVVSKNLPQKSVSTVEIYENHQPLKILEERISSQQAALNIKLKRDITTTGTAKLGIGTAPLLWDVNITPMTFTKSFQMVSSYQSNNTGNDVSRQLKVLTLNDLVRHADRPTDKPMMLGILDVSQPQIEQRRYLDNRVHLINLNGLQRISKDFQLRANLYYINDRRQQEASLVRTLYTPADTLSFSEEFDNSLHDNYLLGEFTLSRNVKKNYLNNTLKIQSRWDNRTGTVFTPGENINQSLDNPFRSVSNSLRSVKPVGKHLVELNSYISYDQSPHRLSVMPGQFAGALNDSLPYEATKQQVELTRFYIDNSASVVLGWKGFTYTPRLGLAWRQQTLESQIHTLSTQTESAAGSAFANNLKARHSQAYLHNDVEYRKKKLTITLKLPLSWQQISLDEQASEEGQELTRILLDPRLMIDYKLTNFWRLRGGWSYTNSLGDIDGIYYGFILKNYRSLSRNAAPLSENTRHSFSAHLAYRNPITSFFNTLTYIYTLGHTNLTYSNLVQADGTSIIQARDLPQTTHIQSLQLYTSKFFSASKTTITLHAGLNQQKEKSLINGELFDTKNRFYNIRPELNVRITPWLNVEYALDATLMETYIDEEEKSNISLLRHKVNIFAFPTRKQMISLETEYYDYKESQNFFADLLFRYTFSKQKLDVELRWNNIFNNLTYTSLQASTFTVYESVYQLRPSQVLLSVKFGF